jgi:hypothetical protein
MTRGGGRVQGKIEEIDTYQLIRQTDRLWREWEEWIGRRREVKKE